MTSYKLPKSFDLAKQRLYPTSPLLEKAFQFHCA